MLVPSAEMVNVAMNPSVDCPAYASTYVSESSWTRELKVPPPEVCSNTQATHSIQDAYLF